MQARNGLLEPLAIATQPLARELRECQDLLELEALRLPDDLVRVILWRWQERAREVFELPGDPLKGRREWPEASCTSRCLDDLV